MPINTIFSWLIRKRLHQIDLFLKYPIEVQNEVLHELIRAARYTSWGKQYDYASIKNYETFRERVPLQHYSDIRPYVDRLLLGEQNLLWHTSIDWFAKSSGTTSDKSKYIPVSREALEDCHYRGGKDLLGLYINNKKKTKIYTGKCLVVGGSSSANPLGGEASYIGDLSAIIIKYLPLWVEMRRTPDRSIALMDKWDEKIEAMAKTTSKENVSNIVGVPSWVLVLMKRILEITGKNHILEVWPNLELYMHGGISFKPYRKQFEKLLPGNQVNYIESYNASEGFFGIQDRFNSDDMLLMLDYGMFYEFIPMTVFGEKEPKAIPLSEVQMGENYALVISTNAGLWRYVIGDTIRFTSLSPYRIQVTGRTKHFINAFGEELIIDNAENALKTACDKTGAGIREYTGAPRYMNDHETGGHEWLIEFSTVPQSMVAFTEAFDAALKAVNSDYEAKRSYDLTLRMPLIQALPKGTFYLWMKSKGKLGGQHKVPRLANNREYLEAILAFAENAFADV